MLPIVTLHFPSNSSKDFAMILALLQHLAIMSSKKRSSVALLLVFREWRDLK
jgi:hypothetical protein